MQDKTIQNRTNPFFVPYNTPHDTVPFERIRLEDYEPAFMEGIRRDDHYRLQELDLLRFLSQHPPAAKDES